MDQRQTFDNYQTLKAILFSLRQQNEKASFLVEQEGLTRVEGTIAAIEDEPSTGQVMVTINNHPSAAILLKDIIAVNGIFRSDYTEC